MLSARHNNRYSASMAKPTAPLRRPGDRVADVSKANREGVAAPWNTIVDAVNAPDIKVHPLTIAESNALLNSYECSVKSAFDSIAPVIKEISELSTNSASRDKTKQLISKRLGFQLPDDMFVESSGNQIDVRRLYAWCLFETYQQYCDSFNNDFPRCMDDNDFQSFLHECGFHALDVSPCSDGRLAHVISFVLRLPFRSVRRKSYAGAMFDIEDNLEKWVETEFLRFREGKINAADTDTRYLKTVVYHYSSLDPDHEGCAAHSSRVELAAKAGMERLVAFKKAIENTFCCGASIDYLLIGLDTDTDVIRIHSANGKCGIDLDKYIESKSVYESTLSMRTSEAKDWITKHVESVSHGSSRGMVNLISLLLINNISQIDYVRKYHGQHYADIGHAEYFIGAGMGFEEVQLRNLTYFAYLDTVEESAKDLDVGIKIFSRLNIYKGLPVPIVVRYDYHNNVPGARERAIQHCYRVSDALNGRYEGLVSQGLLHTLLVIRDVDSINASIEVLACSAKYSDAMESN